MGVIGHTTGDDLMPTLAMVQAMLLGRASDKMAVVGMDAATSATPNADLFLPIRRALVIGGIPLVSTGSTLSDADMSGVDGLALERILDYATWELLGEILGRFAQWDRTAGQDLQKYQQFASETRELMKMYEDRLRRPIGPFMGTMRVGTMSTGARGMPNDPFQPWRTWTGPRNWPYPSTQHEIGSRWR